MRGVHSKTDAGKRRVAGEDRVRVPNSITAGRWDSAAAPAQMTAAGVNTVVYLSSPACLHMFKAVDTRGGPSSCGPHSLRLPTPGFTIEKVSSMRTENHWVF